MAESKKCTLCDIDFKCVPALVSHLRWNHNIISNFKCGTCNEKFLTKKEFIIHKKSHKKPSAPLKCLICNDNFEKTLLINHFKQSHNIDIEEEEFEFDSLENFFTWKKNVESTSTSYFVMRTTPVKTKTGVTKTYVCHRDGNYISRGNNKKKMKSKGSNKINGHCPAKLTLRCVRGKVFVHFVKTHVGHSMDIERINIPKEEKDRIAQKIASKVPFEEILDELKNSISEGNVERTHLITRKDLHNIMQKYKLNNGIVKQPADSCKPNSWLKQMESDAQLVRFYKPKGVLSDKDQNLQEDDFFFVFANDVQLLMLSKYGNGTVSIDITPGNNSCEFDLCSIMVLDDNQDAFPCAFMFSNRNDIIAMKLFFRVIKDLVTTDLCPEYFFTDTNDYIFNAWKSVMSRGFITAMYNAWSLENDWKLNLASIPQKEVQAEIYKLLKSLMEVNDLNIFVDSSNDILKQLYANPETVEFAKYIERFFKHPTTWAYCFRRDSINNIKTGIENLWKFSKLLYFKRKKIKKLDASIYDVMLFLKQRLFKFPVVNQDLPLDNFSDISNQHLASIELSNCDIYIIDDKWYVPSNNDSESEKYEVEAISLSCDCNWRCEDCTACIHSYKCSCPDFGLHWKMCKHIHLIATITKHSILTENFEDWGMTETLIQCEVISPPDFNDITCEDILEQPETVVVATEQAPSPSAVSVETAKQNIRDQFSDTLNIIETLEEAHILQELIAPAKEMILSHKKR